MPNEQVFAMAIDQVSEMSPRVAMRATPIDAMVKADAADRLPKNHGTWADP
jgi:hypothetical protein